MARRHFMRLEQFMRIAEEIGLHMPDARDRRHARRRQKRISGPWAPENSQAHQPTIEPEDWPDTMEPHR